MEVGQPFGRSSGPRLVHQGSTVVGHTQLAKRVEVAGLHGLQDVYLLGLSSEQLPDGSLRRGFAAVCRDPKSYGKKRINFWMDDVAVRREAKCRHGGISSRPCMSKCRADEKCPIL